MTQFKTSLGLGSDINPRMVITDKGYDSAANRAAARACAITAVIPRKTNSKARGRFFPTNFYKLRRGSSRPSESSSGSNASPCGVRKQSSPSTRLSASLAA
jgi:hypothetical protein